jgi:hypothetical protein
MRPHMPQLVIVSSGRSQPLVRSPSQSPKPGEHATNAHVPVVHDALAFAKPHRGPHPHRRA